MEADLIQTLSVVIERLLFKKETILKAVSRVPTTKWTECIIRDLEIWLDKTLE